MPGLNRLASSHALLTGVGGGIGLAVVEAYLNEGARCTAVDLAEQPSAGLQQLLERFPERLHYVGADVTQLASIATMMAGFTACVTSPRIIGDSCAGPGNCQARPSPPR